ncbi:MAG: hypothetical protein WCK78_19650, partial [Paludibacter sp.]
QLDFYPFVRYADPNDTILGLIAQYDNPNEVIFTLLYGSTTQTTRFLPFRTVRRPQQRIFWLNKLNFSFIFQYLEIKCCTTSNKVNILGDVGDVKHPPSSTFWDVHAVKHPSQQAERDVVAVAHPMRQAERDVGSSDYDKKRRQNRKERSAKLILSSKKIFSDTFISN